MADLVELDSLEIIVIVDNELDPISPSPNPAVQQTGGLREIAIHGPTRSSDGGESVKELRMDNICCSAHGLSLMITGIKGDQRHTILFDTGPEEHVWERNANRLRAKVGEVEAVVLSHWHRDHSGGMLKALEMVKEANGGKAVDVDLHPARPAYRGMQPPGFPVVSLEADPTFSDIEDAGGIVRKNDSAHTVLDDTFLISGEIPRTTSYETGLRFGVRCNGPNGPWSPDTTISDERFLMCKLKDKGLVMFTGCSHAGVVNASKHALEFGGGAPLYAVMGGFHLADADKAQIEATAEDLKKLDAKVLMTGHCTGWRAKFELQKVMPEGVLVPSFVGTKFVL